MSARVHARRRKHAAVIALIVSVCMLFSPRSILADSDPNDGAPTDHPFSILEHFDAISNLRQGVRTYQASSYHRAGGNADLNQFVETVGDENVLLDVKGPGCVCRIWWTSTDPGDGRIRIYFDGSATPLIDMAIVDFFGGAGVPFLAPLVGDASMSSGGCYCYVPMPFREGCRIATTSDLEISYYNITYQRFADATGVTTFTGQEDTSAARAIWENAGTDPKTDPGQVVVTDSLALPADANAVLLDVPSAGVIQRFELTIPGLTPGEASKDLLSGLRLLAWWDGGTEPAIDAPAGEFFGSGLGAHDVRALPVGMDGERLYCYLPMPFGTAARLELRNEGETDVSNLTYLLRYTPLDGTEANPSRFHAKHRCEVPTSEDKDYVILTEAGAGHFVGVVQTIRSQDATRSCLEGDERIYVDGARTPMLHGTGTEDFYNGGWYFENGPFALPVHGNPAHEPGARDATTCYRFFLSDLIPFTTGIKVGIEHGPMNWETTPDICSVAFYYKAPQPLATLTDEVNVGDQASETAHGYTIGGQTWWGITFGLYEGYESDEPTLIGDNGRRTTGYSQFTVAVGPVNAGVLLRRRLDYRLPRQEAEVYVDDVYAGRWYEAGSNPYLYFRDSEFMVPAALTQDKSNITVRLEAITTSSDWSEYRYWVYTLKRLDDVGRYLLNVAIVNQTLGDVSLSPEPEDPNRPTYPIGTTVVLSGEPTEGGAFGHWEIYDSNHPGDVNYVVIDTNQVITVVMTADREVTAVFKCGSSLGMLVPVPPLLVLAVMLARRRTGTLLGSGRAVFACRPFRKAGEARPARSS